MKEAATPSTSENGIISAKHVILSRELTSGSAQPTTSKEVAELVPADDNDCTKDSSLRAPTSSNEQPTTSKGTARDGNPLPRRRFLSLSGRLFNGVLETSQRGIHPVLRYSLPGGEYCYAFAFLRAIKRSQVVVYRCIACKKKGITISIAVQNESEFIGDPAELAHVCTPLLNAKDKVQRMVYQSCRAIATDPTLAEAKPNQLWKSIAELIDKNAADDDVLRSEMLKQFYKGGYKSRSRTIARAAAKLRRATLGNVASEQEGEVPAPESRIKN
ncbi:hypothetical protein OSTOST_02634 [Ostertagia ostertagi]